MPGPSSPQFSISTTTHTVFYPDVRLWGDPRCSTRPMTSLEKNSSSPYTEFNSKQIAQCSLKHDTFRVTEQRNSWLGTERDRQKAKLNPQTVWKLSFYIFVISFTQLSMVAHTYILSTWEAEAKNQEFKSSLRPDPVSNTHSSFTRLQVLVWLLGVHPFYPKVKKQLQYGENPCKPWSPTKPCL